MSGTTDLFRDGDIIKVVLQGVYRDTDFGYGFVTSGDNDPRHDKVRIPEWATVKLITAVGYPRHFDMLRTGDADRLPVGAVVQSVSTAVVWTKTASGWFATGNATVVAGTDIEAVADAQVIGLPQ